MNTALMRFQDYTWKHNPKTIQVASAAGRSKSGSCPDRETFAGPRPGKADRHRRGELFGEDCLLQFRTLAALANREEPAY